ncbi:MAG: hypothetical protein JJ971_12310 [Balneolaceae bacterium]|nr:hypothetical protein [Balneolaceae bacterium]MBO6547365.1 hypothetical protein [Balneolaceae bacterium]MBO6647688.1 hypothetical protein [Balneolaceae bacterium]
MRFKFAVIFFFTIAFLLNCNKIESNIPPNEYAVYNDFFNHITESDEVEIDSVSIAILDSTSIRKDLSLNIERITMLQKEWGFELSKELINDFITKNSSKHFIQDHFETELKYQIVVTNEIDEIFKNSFSWLIFEERFTNVKSILGFSRVGLNTQKDKALLFVSINCGPLCGSTWFYYLENVDNKWILAHEKMLTVS